MRDTKFLYLVLICILLTGLVVSACSLDTNSPLDGKSVLEDQCVECHNLSRVKSASKTRDEWSRTIDRMIAFGAELNSEEQRLLLDYLESTYP